MITGPLRDRFGLVARLDYYDDDELEAIVVPRGRHPRRRRSTTTGRGRSPAARGARRASPTACCAGCATSPRCAATARSTPTRRATGWRVFGVDDRGLDKVDRAILGALCQQFGGGPVGLSTLAISVGEQPETVEDVYEPFLIQQGMLARTPRGRVAMPAAYDAPRPRCPADRARRPVRLTPRPGLFGLELAPRRSARTPGHGEVLGRGRPSSSTTRPWPRPRRRTSPPRGCRRRGRRPRR